MDYLMDKEVAGWDPNTVNASASQQGLCTSDVPQDPALGPVLLSIFNNDTDSETESHAGIPQRTPG